MLSFTYIAVTNYGADRPLKPCSYTKNKWTDSKSKSEDSSLTCTTPNQG
jgi:hypothetical protein